MKRNSLKYSKFALCNEMMETVSVVSNFKQEVSKPFIEAIKQRKKILLTGEGSSRIFPAKHFRELSLTLGRDYFAEIEGARQAMEYRLDDTVVFGVSNSGKTKELVSLFTKLKNSNHPAFFGLTATPDTPVATLPLQSVVLSCGKENAVAATKSVVEQALFFESILYNYAGLPMPNLVHLAAFINVALSIKIDSKIIKLLSNAPIIYFAGRNDGVAEELTLKTNEITRKKSLFLEGTYALHGIEEVMKRGEALIVIEPFAEEEQKFREVLVEGAGVEVIAIASRPTSFPTILIPGVGNYRNYVELAAGWNILTEIGQALHLNIDKPEHARKIGNEG